MKKQKINRKDKRKLEKQLQKLNRQKIHENKIKKIPINNSNHQNHNNKISNIIGIKRQR